MEPPEAKFKAGNQVKKFWNQVGEPGTILSSNYQTETQVYIYHVQFPTCTSWFAEYELILADQNQL